MATLVAVPAWAVPTEWQVRDACRLARLRADQTGSPRDVGRFGGLEWALIADPALPDVVAALGDAVAASRPYSPRAAFGWREQDHAAGFAEALAWLVGAASTPGFELPRRRPDGEPVTAQELLAETAMPSWWEPEQRAAARRTAEQTALRYAALAELADSVR